MAQNNLTPEVDLATRDYFMTIVNDEAILAEHPALRKSLITTLLTMLNYTWLPNGAFVEAGQNITMKFGNANYDDYPNEWEADKERAIENLNNQGTSEASSSGETENTSLWKAVLPKDV